MHAYSQRETRERDERETRERQEREREGQCENYRNVRRHKDIIAITTGQKCSAFDGQDQEHGEKIDSRSLWGGKNKRQRSLGGFDPRGTA